MSLLRFDRILIIDGGDDMFTIPLRRKSNLQYGTLRAIKRSTEHADLTRFLPWKYL